MFGRDVVPFPFVVREGNTTREFSTVPTFPLEGLTMSELPTSLTTVEVAGRPVGLPAELVLGATTFPVASVDFKVPGEYVLPVGL